MRWIKSTLLAALALVALSAADTTEQDFRCEEAAAHLADCCDGFDPRKLNCTTGCSSHNALTTDESKCIVELECALLVSGHVCSRVQNGNDAGGPVCP